MPPRGLVSLAGGRQLAFDDVGMPTGVPVVYLHGTPDSRLARHPDDGIAARLGVRLVAVDRPGAGASPPRPPGGGDVGADLAALLDQLGIDRAVLVGWSSGGLAALAAAASLGQRVRGVLTLGALPPVEAYGDTEVLAATGPSRRAFMAAAAELLAGGMRPLELAEEVVPHLVPDPLDEEAALQVVLDGAGALGRAELAAVPGSAERLAAALVEALGQGIAGLAAVVSEQLEPVGPLERVSAPVELWHGELDEVGPPAAGRWLAARLPDARVRIVPDGAHHLLFPRWAEVLAASARMY